MRWRLIVEEYGPELRYLQGHKNIVADALSRLHLTPKLDMESDISVLEEHFSRPMCKAFGLSKKQAKNTIAPSIPICYSTILAAHKRKSFNLTLNTGYPPFMEPKVKISN